MHLVRLCLGALLVASASTVSAQNYISFAGGSGEYISQGQALTLSDPIATRNFDNGISFNVSGQLTSFNLNFSAPMDAEISPGFYAEATRWPFQDADAPGLSFSGDGRGCNTLNGHFEVFEATYGPSGEIATFAANFEQYCEGASPPLLGEVRFNTVVPEPGIYTLGLLGVALGLTLGALLRRK